MKYRLLSGLVGSLLTCLACSGTDSVTQSLANAEAPGEAAVETEAERDARMRQEGELLQAALDAQYSPEEQAAMVAQLERERSVDFSASLTREEMRIVHARLASEGIAAERVSFAGRLVSLDGSDGYYEADALLGESPLNQVDKNYVLSGLIGDPAPYHGGSPAPEIFARQSGANFQFWRPALSVADFPGVRRVYYLVLTPFGPGPVPPNPPAVPSSIRTALVDAARSVENANSNDCLVSGTFVVIDYAAYAALPAGDKTYHYAITVQYTPTTATPGVSSASCNSIRAYACATFPRQIARSYTTSTNPNLVSRMSFGHYIGIPSNGALLSPTCGNPPADGCITQEDRKEFLAHEIGHLIGLSHPFADGAAHLRVPGTASRNQDVNQPGNYQSFMDYDPVNVLNARAVSSDDQLAMRKLYPANGCGYTNGFQTIQ